ncbi:MAG: hypothetical protein LWW95_04195 [Candidatus Desulfofervidus auxilii]|nr:hypothetical protein [Candidatus Desulfofervidus auxilii]
MPELSKIFDNKKYMWDGEIYDTEEAAKSTAQKYEQDGFEIKIVEENGKYLIYNRREIKT